MPALHPNRIAIIGGGFSGTMVATHLLRKAPEGTQIHLVERRLPLGRGVAYGTRYDSHVLNVRASGMSALPDDPQHFVRWAQARPELFEQPVQPTDFVSRRVYGMYVQATLEDAAANRDHSVGLVRWADEAVDMMFQGDAAWIALESGDGFEADKVVLAIGHFPPGHPPISDRSFYSSERYVGDPWTRGHLDAVSRDDAVLLIGSGLTALDLALALKDRGHRGLVHLLSRSGRLPQPHRMTEPYADFLSEREPRTLREMFRLVHREIADASEKGTDWRSVLDAIRPHTQRLWKRLDSKDRRRFMRHVRSLWDTHRHRMPPQVEALAAELQAAGRLQLHAGKLEGFEEASSGLFATYRRKDGERETIFVQHVVNCTGPECDYRRMRHPLVAGLLGQGLVRPDDLALGLDTDDDGALLGADGAVSTAIFTLGPLRKGALWETTAVPEIRAQAAALARLLCEPARIGPQVPSGT